MIEPKNFAPRLREVRLRAGLTLKALASRVGVAESTLSRAELGRQYPGLDVVCALANALGVTLDDLVREPDGGELPSLLGRPRKEPEG